jgi:hypothetical protein
LVLPRIRGRSRGAATRSDPIAPPAGEPLSPGRTTAEATPAALRSRLDGAGTSGPIQQLERLADLRDRGVLTDAEFATEKAKIIQER